MCICVYVYTYVYMCKERCVWKDSYKNVNNGVF